MARHLNALVVVYRADHTRAAVEARSLLRHLVDVGADVRVVLWSGGTTASAFAALAPTYVVDDVDAARWSRALRVLGWHRLREVLASIRLRTWAGRRHWDLVYLAGRRPGRVLAYLGRRPRLVACHVHDVDLGEDVEVPVPAVDLVLTGQDRVAADVGGDTPVLRLPSASPPAGAAVDRPGALVVVGAGAPDWWARPEIFLRVAELLARRRPDLDVHHVWLDDGDERATWMFRHDAELSGIAERVHVRPHAECAAWARAADVVLISTREEDLPMLATAAVDAGTPVVGADLGGVPELATTVVPYLDVPAAVAAVEAQLAAPTAASMAQPEPVAWDELLALIPRADGPRSRPS